MGLAQQVLTKKFQNHPQPRPYEPPKVGFSTAPVVNFIDVFQLCAPLKFMVGCGSNFWDLGLLKGVLDLSCALSKIESPPHHSPRDLKHLAYRIAILQQYQGRIAKCILLRATNMMAQKGKKPVKMTILSFQENSLKILCFSQSLAQNLNVLPQIAEIIHTWTSRNNK